MVASVHVGRRGIVSVSSSSAISRSHTLPGTTAADTVLHRLAGALKTPLAQRKTLAKHSVEETRLMPLAGALTYMPGTVVRAADRSPIEIGGASDSASAVHLATPPASPRRPTNQTHRSGRTSSTGG